VVLCCQPATPVQVPGSKHVSLGTGTGEFDPRALHTSGWFSCQHTRDCCSCCPCRHSLCVSKQGPVSTAASHAAAHVPPSYTLGAHTPALLEAAACSAGVLLTAAAQRLLSHCWRMLLQRCAMCSRPATDTAAAATCCCTLQCIPLRIKWQTAGGGSSCSVCWLCCLTAAVAADSGGPPAHRATDRPTQSLLRPVSCSCATCLPSAAQIPVCWPLTPP
jgi:hypothetical protein